MEKYFDNNMGKHLGYKSPADPDSERAAVCILIIVAQTHKEKEVKKSQAAGGCYAPIKCCILQLLRCHKNVYKKNINSTVAL